MEVEMKNILVSLLIFTIFPITAFAQLAEIHGGIPLGFRYLSNAENEDEQAKTDFFSDEVGGFHAALLFNLPFIPPVGVTHLEIRNKDEAAVFKTNFGITTVNTIFPVPFLDSIYNDWIFLRLGLGAGILKADTRVSGFDNSFYQETFVSEIIVKLGFPTASVDWFGILGFNVHVAYHRFMSGDIHHLESGKKRNLSGDSLWAGLHFNLLDLDSGDE